MRAPLAAWMAAVAAVPRWRTDAAARLGLGVPPIQPGAVWIHASSVGEVSAALGLAAHLDPPILVTATTDTGAAVARASGIPGVVGAVLPADHPWTLAPLWAEARPRALVFIESGWWPVLAATAARHGVPVIRASATAGSATRRLPAGAVRWWTRGAARVLARDAENAHWFALNQDAPVEVVGDLKAARALPPPQLRWSRPFIVGASTREGDEEAVLAAVQRAASGAQLLLAPRHPERFESVAAWLGSVGVHWARRSALTGAVPADLDVVLLDTMGELAAELAGARGAFIGGTFDPKVGGHSPMEAWLQGVPVFAGEEVSSHAGAFHACGASFAVNPAGLADALRSARPPARPPPDPGARIAACVRALAGPPAPESPPRPWALPLAPVVRAARHLRGRPQPVDAVVVAVGSANARGSGKTSVGRAVARRLKDLGHVVGVVVRGHRRARSGTEVRLSHDDDSAAAIGDEGSLYAGDGRLVASGIDRLTGAKLLIARGCTAIVLDDGLQQRAVAADVRIDVVDARFPRARGPLPAGEGRPTAPTDLTVALNGRWGDAIVGRRTAGPWHRGAAPAPPPPGPVAVFAGLPRPADLLAVVDVPVQRFRALPNHAPIGPDLARSLHAWADGLPLVCSKRDWVRLPPRLAAEVWWRDQAVELDADLPLPGPR